MSENINFSECSINGICSSTNTVSSQCEIVMLYVRQLAFYLLKLKEYGITNDLIRNDVTDILYGLFMHAGYTQEKYSETITKLETFISQSVFLYERYCKEHNIKIDKSIKRLKKIHTVEDFIKADKNIATKNELTPEQRNLHEVMFFLCSSIIIKHIELQRLGVDYKEAYYCVLSLLTTCMDKDFTYESVRTLFNNAVDIYIEVVKLIYATQKKLYGKIRETDVNTSSFEGKSILISGCDMKVLQTILDLTKDTSINIYTHGFEMIVAHTLPVLAKYDHLAGHFSVNKDNYIADFSTFKGPILLSRVYMENVDSLYRGRLFSLDPYVNKGVIKIVENDFSALIKAASIAPGFKKAHKRDSIHAGFDEKKVLEFTDEVLEKLKEGEYERLYVIGICNCSHKDDYYEQLINNLPENSYVLSFSYDTKAENVFHINSLYDGRLFLKVFRHIKAYNDKNISVFVTNAGRHTVSNLLVLKNMGFRQVFCDKSLDKVITAHTKEFLQNKFSIDFTTDVMSDIEKTL